MAKNVSKNWEEHEEIHARQYFQNELPDEEIILLEKIKTEKVFGKEINVWELHSNEDKYWLITNPTNLYYQDTYGSLDTTISFHIGFTARVMHGTEPENFSYERFSATQRMVEDNGRQLQNATEAEEFQAVGMRCRESLISFVSICREDENITEIVEPPKAADFTNWAHILANHYAGGSSNKDLRSYLKKCSSETWQYVNWLTHNKNATYYDALFSTNSVEHLLLSFTITMAKHEIGENKRCPNCHSYRIETVSQKGEKKNYRNVVICKSCGWKDLTI